jgi:hypothetical protein
MQFILTKVALVPAVCENWCLLKQLPFHDISEDSKGNV